MAVENLPADASRSALPSTLGDLPRHALASVTSVRLRGAEAAWLRAIGIFEGQRVTVLRRALLGGPLHVRTASGGEFAIDRTLALAIEVTLDLRVVES
jgi:ferrous iron transport protein A